MAKTTTLTCARCQDRLLNLAPNLDLGSGPAWEGVIYAQMERLSGPDPRVVVLTCKRCKNRHETTDVRLDALARLGRRMTLD